MQIYNSEAHICYNANMKKTIGILGGLGPESSALFYGKLISEFQKRFKPRSNAEYPHIIINSISAHDFMTHNADEILTEYIQGLETLVSAGAQYIAITCNTAHNFIDKYKKTIHIPIIDLRSIVKTYFESERIKKYIVFGTADTIKRGLYDYENMEVVNLDDEEVEHLTQAIVDMNLGDKQNSSRFIINLYKKYVNSVDVILVACSEVSLILSGEEKVVDTMDLLLEEVLNRYEEK